MAKRRQEEKLEQLKAAYPELVFTGLGKYETVNRTPVYFICSVHGEQESKIRYMQGAGAKGCLRCAEKPKMTSYEGFLARFSDVLPEGYSFKPDGYTNGDGKVRLVCPKHGESDVNVSSYARKNAQTGCRKCADEGTASKLRKGMDVFISQAREIFGDKYKYGGVYVNQSTPIEVICEIHGTQMQTPEVHLRGHGCKRCGYASGGEKGRLAFTEFISRANEEHNGKYTYDEASYLGSSFKTKIVCEKHGEFYQTPRDHTASNGRATGCPKCPGANKSSKGEQELATFLAGYIQIQTGFRYSRKEFDVLIPEKNLAIEYDGLIWHSTKYRTREEQLRKRADADSLGINLIRIFEHEWLYRRKQVESLILSRLGLTKKKVYARMCSIVEVSNDKATDFHNEYHVQGWHRTGKSYGLALDGEVLAVMTFTENLSSRKVEEGVHELVRFSSKVQVLGGASRLLKHYVKNHKPEKILSYSDKRLFSGRLYETLGFSKVHDVAPSYSYWREGTMTLQHKSLFRRDNLPSILGTAFDPAKTEKQNCEENGYYQVYDDGKIRWELTPK